MNLESIIGFPKEKYENLNEFAINPVILIIVTILLVLYYVLFASLGVTNESSDFKQTNGKGILLLETVLWSLFILLLLLNGIYYIFNINVIASIKNLFSKNHEHGLIGKNVSSIKDDILDLNIKQLFHIPGNNYTYSDSKAICNAYGANLATYKNLEDAYKKGADWCSYGWSEGQMAYFPTQYKKWEKLQKIKGHEQDCGRPGINGGYIANPNVKFGVNCYGYKPKISPLDYEFMQNTMVYPKTQEEIDFDRNVDKWKQKIPEITVAPFNNSRWSVI